MPKKSPRELVEEALEAILIVDRSEMTPGANLREDLRADDLDMVEIVMALEEDCGITVDEDDAEKPITVQDFVSMVEKKMGANGRTDL